MFPYRQSGISALLSNLAESRAESDLLVELQELASRSSIGAAGEFSRELSVDRAGFPAFEAVSEGWRKRLDELAERPPATAEYRVFRREAPLAPPVLDLAAPLWGRGAAIERSLGPFPSLDGRQFWFDFYRLTRLAPLYLPGETQPALLFYVREFPVPLDRPLPVAEILGLLRTRRYNLAAGSFWIRAGLLAPGAPAGAYVGLRIAGGQLQFTPPPVEAGGRLTLPPGGQCGVQLRLQQPAGPPAGSSQAGIDAAQAGLRLPEQFSFLLQASGVTVQNVGAAGWTLYGQSIDFTWRSGGLPEFTPPLQSVTIPLQASAARFDPAAVQSPFARTGGGANIQRSAWVLPAAQLDVDSPVEASGSGALAVSTSQGLTLTWRGLRDGPVELRSPWIALWPGMILIADPQATNRYANQRFLLWKDQDSRFRSRLDLRYTGSFPVAYASGAAGSEILSAQADTEARLDRPVDVKGTPLPVRTLKSLLLLTYTDLLQQAFVYDDNILVDSLDPNVKWPVEPGRAKSLAIRNALFTVSPVNSLVLFAELLDEETVSKATLMLGMGLFGLLPTLPDPYAANVGWLRRQGRLGQSARQTGLLLVSSVAWAKAAADVEPDSANTSFAFAPLGTQQQALAVWSSAAARTAAAGPALEPVLAADPAGQPPGSPFAASAVGRGANDVDWNRRFQRFEQEQFRLLDVSTNADQMGVSFAWFNAAALNDRDYVFYEIYKATASQPSPAYPLQVRDLDLSAQSRYVRAFTVPQLSWEPLFNLTNPAISGDPPPGWNLYPNDGGPTRLFNDSVELVPIAPIPVSEFLVQDFDARTNGFTGALFTLPFGLRAFAEFSRKNQFVPNLDPAKLAFNRPEYEGGLKGALQIRADAPKHPAESPIFKGSTFQLNNVLFLSGAPSYAGTLGSSVGTIFNNEFFYDGNTGYKDRGVPLTRIDFCGYGASMFSHWQNPNAAIAATSQAFFDVFVGRTGEEVIQVRSLVYPWGIRVVRTITMFRASNSYVFRFDTGWQAESDGVYDFRYRVYNTAYNVIEQPNPYEFHPGIVKGVFRVRNIRETNAVPNFTATWNKQNGDPYVDDNGILRTVDASTPASERNPGVNLQPVYFDCDVAIDYVVSGAAGGRVPSRGMLGYVQLAPRGEPISPQLFAQLLATQFGSLGGPVDCVIDVGKSGQQVRLSRADVNASQNAGGQPIFVSAGRGAVILPKDGAWSVVQHNQGSGEVSPLDPQAAVPVIRRGRLNSATQTTDATVNDLLRIANPIDLVQPPGPNTRNYGLLQSTNTQKALFRLPSFKEGLDQLLGAPPDFADAYRILNSKGIFPNVQDAFPLNLGTFQTRILAQGYKLVDQFDPNKVFEQILPEGPLYLINEDFLKLYVEYARKDKNGNKLGDGILRYGFDAAAAELGKSWMSKLNDIAMVADLGSLKRLMMVKGKFDTQKGAAPAFVEPQLEFSDDLQPVIDILQVLLMLQGGDYQAAFQKGLEIAMSNSADSWNYAFHARKEIPVVKFPPGALYDQPSVPLKLECHLAVGVYFNEALAIPSSPGQLIPSTGAFLEFGGRLSVMCVSLAAATIYATGSVDLRTAADIKTGPSLHMKFGFGAEIVVGLPVVGSVSLLYMVGVEINLDTSQITVAGFLLFRGRAEILGGIVTVTIMIEAKGMVKRISAPSERTDLIAQVTFGLDISIFLVINISFSESWQESRQIA